MVLLDVVDGVTIAAMSPQPGPPSTSSASAIDVQKYTGTCLISHKARSRKQKPCAANNENNNNKNGNCNCCNNTSCSPPTSPGVNLAWAGLPLISLATTNTKNKQKGRHNHHHQNQKVKNTLALHAKGIPLILSPSTNYNYDHQVHPHQIHCGWHWPPPPHPPHPPHTHVVHGGHGHQQPGHVVSQWQQYGQRFCSSLGGGHGVVAPPSVDSGAARSPQRTSSSVSSGSCSSSSTSSFSGNSDSMSVTSEESASGGRGVDGGNNNGSAMMVVVPRVIKARKRRKKDSGKKKVVTSADKMVADEGPGGLVTLQPYMPLCFGFTDANEDELNNHDDDDDEVVIEKPGYPNQPSPLCTCMKCAPCPPRRTSTCSSSSASGDEVAMFPTPPSTPNSECEADGDGRFWTPEDDDDDDDEEDDEDEFCKTWDTMATSISRESFKFPLNISNPPSRPWITIAQPAKSQPTCIFTVMCYNVLCDKYATRQMYGYCPNWALSWEYRRKAILDEIRHYNADIITLQEVETDQFYNFFMPELTRDGFDGIFSPKSRAKTMSENDRKFVDGCAIFFRMSKFKLMKKHLVEFTQLAMANAEGSDDMLNRVMTKDNIGLSALLETKEGAWENGLPVDGSSVRQPLLVCTAHIHWDPEYCDVKLIQTMMLMNELRAIVEDSARSFRPGIHKPDPNAIPLILCGDFNSLPDSGVIEFLSSGHISADHPDFKELGYKSCLQKLSSSERPNEYMHSFRLSRSYENDVMPYTNYTFDFKGVIDYILFSKQYMAPLGILGPLDPLWLKEHKVVGCPHPHIPSDHFPLLVELEMLPQPQALSNITNGLILRR